MRLAVFAFAYASGLVGVTLDGRPYEAVWFLCVAVAAAAVRHWGGTWWQRQETRLGTGYSEV